MNRTRRNVIVATFALLSQAGTTMVHAQGLTCDATADAMVEQWLRSLAPRVVASIWALSYAQTFSRKLSRGSVEGQAWSQASLAAKAKCIARLHESAETSYRAEFRLAEARLPTVLVLEKLWPWAQKVGASICMSGATDCFQYPIPLDCGRRASLKQFLTSATVKQMNEDQLRVLDTASGWAVEGLPEWLALSDQDKHAAVRSVNSVSKALHQFPYLLEGMDWVAVILLMGESKTTGKRPAELMSKLAASKDVQAFLKSIDAVLLMDLLLVVMRDLSDHSPQRKTEQQRQLDTAIVESISLL